LAPLFDSTRSLHLLLLPHFCTRRDHPFLGVGFENFAVAYPRYQQAEWFTLAGMNTTNTSAHDWILHIAATTGIVGLLAHVALLGTFAVHAWRRARDADAVGVLVALAAIAAFYGGGLVLPGAQSIQWIPWRCVGVAPASELRHGAPRVVTVLPPLRLPAVLRLLIVAGMASVAFGQLGSLQASRAVKGAESALGAANASRAVELARIATTVDPGRAVYWNDLGRSLELVPDLAGARSAYRQATSRSPYTPAFWWNLGRMEQECAKQNEPGARLLRSAVRGPAIIGDGAVIEDAYIGPFTSIANDAVISGAELDNSMLFDLRSGARTEVDFINGAVVAAGRRAAVPTPYNETLTALVKAREHAVRTPAGEGARA